MLSPDTLTAKKKSEKSFTYADIEFIVNGYTSGIISDNEMASWLKAVFHHGMNHEETLHYTCTMVKSGVQMDFSHLSGFVLDKHSTGGVGDKVSLILGPLLAVCGCYVPMLSGRGLGHTQGTIDKLESIPGFRSSLSIPEFKQIVEDVGISIMGQTEEICPADRKIYALRDVTNTVASFPLICGSIMSKKIAEGIQGLVLDVKVGDGAFMKSISEAEELGSLLKEVGELHGLKVSVCFTDMNQPLGNTAGLWCEVQESLECLKGNGSDDLMNVVYHLGKEALKLAGIKNQEELLKTAIVDGSALKIFREMVEAHGGSLERLNNPDTHSPKFIEKIYANRDGYIRSMDTLSLGIAIVHLGGGRIQNTDVLDPSVGIIFHKKIGDVINDGDILMEYFCSEKNKFNLGDDLFQKIYNIDLEDKIPQSLIY